MNRCSVILGPGFGRGLVIPRGGSTIDCIEVVTAVGVGLMAVRFTIGLVAEPFWPASCVWVYRAAAALLCPGFAISLLRPSSSLPGLMAVFGLSILVARWFGGDGIETYSPVLAGVFSAMSASTIRRAAVLRVLCWQIGLLAIFAAVLLLIGDLEAGGFRERLGYGWSATYTSAMQLPRDGPSIFNPNEVALPLAVLLSFALSLVATSAHPVFRAAGWLVVTLASFGLLLTGSRGMMLAGLTGLVVFVFSSMSSWGRFLKMIAVFACGGALAVGSLLLLTDLQAELGLRSSFSNQLWTFGDRYPIWETSLMRLAGHPFLGPGRSVIGDELQSPHNTIISALELAGGLGLSVLLILMALLVKRARRSVCFGLPVVMCVFAAGLSIDTLAKPFVWAILGLGCCPASLALCGQARAAVGVPCERRRSGLVQSLAHGKRGNTPSASR